MYLMHEPILMGTKPRLYIHEDVILEIEPGPRLTWGYWGAAIRALNTMWGEWDVIQLEFAVLVESEGVLGRGYLASMPASGWDQRGRQRGGKRR